MRLAMRTPFHPRGVTTIRSFGGAVGTFSVREVSPTYPLTIIILDMDVKRWELVRTPRSRFKIRWDMRDWEYIPQANLRRRGWSRREVIPNTLAPPGWIKLSTQIPLLVIRASYIEHGVFPWGAPNVSKVDVLTEYPMYAASERG